MIPDALLEARGLALAFGGLEVVSGFDLSLKPGSLTGLIGPNGAGKTSVFNLLTGVYKPLRGSILIRGREASGLRPHGVAALGLSRTFQNIRLFRDLTVLENCMVGAQARQMPGLVASLLRSPGFQSRTEEAETQARRCLALVGLEFRAGETSRNLTYGDQRRLEIARSLSTGAELLLLDEPAAGMSPIERRDLMDLIRKLRGDLGKTVLLIEHDMKVVMGLCDDLVVLDHGVTLARGTPSEVQKNPEVIRAYLGDGGSAGIAPSPRLPVSPSVQAPLLQVSGLHVHYGPIHAVQGLSLRVDQGEAVALIGGNGAGKSSTLRALSGLVRPSGGQVLFAGQDLSGRAAEEISRGGLIQAPEGRGIFLNLTVEENLDLGRALRVSPQGLAEDEAECFELFPRLKDRLSQTAGTLSGGEQQMLALARAILSKPRLLLLDEPSLGLAPQVVSQIFEALREINRRGTSLLLVEQNASLALALSGRAYVLESGQIRLEGPSRELAQDPRVKEAYLGL